MERSEDLAEVGGQVVATREPLEVTTTAEPRARAGQQHHARRGVGRDRQHRGHEVAGQREVDAVGGVGPVEGEVGDAVPHLEIDGLVVSHAARD